MTLAPGTRFGAYDVLGALGAGGMGEVYRARDAQLNRDVAIKVLPELFASDPVRLSRFEREAQTLAALNHPHIAQIYGIERSGQTRGLILELVEGPTLEERIAEARIPVADAMAIARQIAEALEAAHAKGIVHRDLKPANIKITTSGSVKVLDFGLAFAVGGSAAGAEAATITATRAGTFAGTAPYMSPEQARGEIVDARTDIWAFGCILYEMVTGTRSFPGTTLPDVIAGVLTREPDWSRLPADLPPLAKRLVRRCLVKDRGERLHDIADARLDLEDAQGFAGDSTMTVDAAPRTRTWRAAIATIGALVLLLALVGYPMFTRSVAPAARTGASSVFGIPEPPGESLYRFVQPVTISPDGQRIAMVTNSADGRSRIWIRSLDALTPELLDGSEGGMFPFWSADGRSLAFFADGQLKAIDLVSRSARTLRTGAAAFGPGSWSRDDTLLLPRHLGEGLGRMSAAGGELQPVTSLDTARGEILHTSPQFLPDQKHFIYFARSTRPGESSVMFGELGSPSQTRLLSIESPATYASPGYLLYGRGAELVAQRFDPARGELAGDPVVIADRLWNVGGFVSLSASESGTIAFATRRTPATQLTFVGRTGRAIGSVGDPGEWVHVEVSPDGQKIAAERLDPKSGTGSVWILDPARKAATRFSLDPSWGLAPVWLHDGTGIVFSSSRGGATDLFVKRLDATEETLLLGSPELKTATDVLADDTVIFTAVTPVEGADVESVNLHGEPRRKPLIQGRYNEASAKVSPDLRWLAYTSNESGRPEVYVRTFGSRADAGRLQVSSGGASQPRWRRDGKELFFVAEDGTLMASAIAEGRTVTAAAPVSLLFKTERDITGWRYTYDVLDLGRRFLVTRTTTADPAPAITIVLNWRERLAR